MVVGVSDILLKIKGPKKDGAKKKKLFKDNTGQKAADVWKKDVWGLPGVLPDIS